MTHKFDIKQTDGIISPQLIYYKDGIIRNTEEAIRIAGGTERLWPHVKSHKCFEMVRLCQSMGIDKFKCATISEAEMLGMAGVRQAVLAYPLVGPNIVRFVKLVEAFPKTKFYAIGDDLGMVKLLGETAAAHNISIPFLVNVDMGMERTGVPLGKVGNFAIVAHGYTGIRLEGLHCYDGNHHESDYTERLLACKETDDKVDAIVAALKQKGIELPFIIMGGSPSFPCHAALTKYYLSPGTIFLQDSGYQAKFPDVKCEPAAVVLCRVISHPGTGKFTTDLGYKAIAADPQGVRGILQNWDYATPILQNEEHWVYQMNKGHEDEVPPVGTVLYVTPIHICPTSALYPSILVAQGGKVIETWEVTARNRKISI